MDTYLHYFQYICKVPFLYFKVSFCTFLCLFNSLNVTNTNISELIYFYSQEVYKYISLIKLRWSTKDKQT